MSNPQRKSSCPAEPHWHISADAYDYSPCGDGMDTTKRGPLYFGHCRRVDGWNFDYDERGVYFKFEVKDEQLYFYYQPEESVAFLQFADAAATLAFLARMGYLPNPSLGGITIEECRRGGVSNA